MGPTGEPVVRLSILATRPLAQGVVIDVRDKPYTQQGTITQCKVVKALNYGVFPDNSVFWKNIFDK